MTPAGCVSAALARLCFRASVAADDGSGRAARAVCAALAAGGCAADLHDTTSPLSCPLATWLRRETRLDGMPYEADGAFLLVGEDCALVFGPRAAGARPVERVPLPAPVRAAVALIAGYGADGLVRGAA